MPFVTGLRSPYALVGRLVYFGRMLDKIRLHARGVLPSDYVVNVGEVRPVVFDARMSRFLGVPHAEIAARTLDGGADEEILAWVEKKAGPRSDEECMIWNRFMSKIGWRDDRSGLLRQRIQELGVKGPSIETFFDMIDFDEGRDPLAERPWELRPLNVFVVMGVSGCGKSTLGRELAKARGWDFLEGDDFHPPANRAKMASGTPLTDDDRWPWLEALRSALDKPSHRGKVLSCSALKEAYREKLAPELSRTRFLYLHATRDLLQERLATRKHEFMPASLVDSQLATLEAPLYALRLDASLPSGRHLEAVTSLYPTS